MEAFPRPLPPELPLDSEPGVTLGVIPMAGVERLPKLRGCEPILPTFYVRSQDNVRIAEKILYHKNPASIPGVNIRNARRQLLPLPLMPPGIFEVESLGVTE